MRITLQELLALDPCDPERCKRLFGDRASLNAEEALLEAGFGVSEILWLLGALGRGDICARFAVACARLMPYSASDAELWSVLDVAMKAASADYSGPSGAIWRADAGQTMVALKLRIKRAATNKGNFSSARTARVAVEAVEYYLTLNTSRPVANTALCAVDRVLMDKVPLREVRRALLDTINGDTKGDDQCA